VPTWGLYRSTLSRSELGLMIWAHERDFKKDELR
jgi:hypothetical protein